MENAEFQQHAQKVEQLVQRVTALSDEGARSTALELMQGLMDLHGSAITRIVEILADSGESGHSSLEKLGRDPLVCGLLVLYGVHPVPFETRVADALDRIAPKLRKQSGSAELLGIGETSVRIAVQGSGTGCHSSPDALKEMVEQAIREIAPEVTELVIETPASVQSGFVPLNVLQPATHRGEERRKEYEESTA
jgi:Fe-S cluster biogenesis protein NfuA